ncbi:MAG TPA: phosphoribosylamine--glycine ligase, partial [Euryarchaeota archaeon]|nr:phosphoribosylamine--glycine ligase [Euryarchaeota archaeon]
LCASPNRAASMLEISKSFARDLMAKHEIPGRVAYRTFDSLDGLDDFLKKMNGEVAVKPVGLTGGKGVKISGEHLKDDDEIRSYCKEILEKSIGGSGFVIEEKLVGEEFTLQAFSDGENVYPLPAVQDHKRAYEGDTGPNTGGMGSYSQADHLLPFLTNEEYLRSVDIVKSTVEAMRKEGCPYKGVIYGQFMLTRSGPKVVEFNARFGDPEAMNVLPLLDGNYVEICTGIARGKVPANEVKFKDLATVCKYVVPKGYGVKSIANEPLHVDEEAISKTGAKIYYAAVDKRDDGLYTTTSRSLGVVGMANTIEEAERRAEMALEYVKGTIFMRHDIGKRASIERKVAHMERVRRG